MAMKTILEEDRDSAPDEFRDHCLQSACEDSRQHAYMQTHVGRDERHQHLLRQAPAARRPGLDLRPSLRGMPDLRNAVQSAIFYEFPRLHSLESIRRQTVEQEKGADPFHDSESEEDVYDLYNACNGVRHNGRLDIRKLDEYSPEEAEAINVPRLREIWDHTASGCSECERIIRTLDLIRGTLRENAEEQFGEQTEEMDVSVIDSIS